MTTLRHEKLTRFLEPSDVLSGGGVVTWKEPAHSYLLGFGEAKADYGRGRELPLGIPSVLIRKHHKSALLPDPESWLGIWGTPDTLPGQRMAQMIPHTWWAGTALSTQGVGLGT